MASIVLQLLGGSAFILLGRWMYRNPSQFYLKAFVTNPESPRLLRLIRIYALFPMILGCYSILIVPVGRLGESDLLLLITLAFAVAVSWFLRPRVSVTYPPKDHDGRMLTANGKWFVWISAAFAIGLTIAAVIFVVFNL